MNKDSTGFYNNLTELHINKIADKIDKTSACWEWSGKLTNNGYPYIKIGSKVIYVRKMLFSFYVEKLVADTKLEHITGINKGCINPYHFKQVPRKCFLFTCDVCQLNVKYTISGKCRTCYDKISGIKRRNTGKSKCHPNRKSYASDLCRECYADSSFKTKRATCHPEKGSVNKGLCYPCWMNNKERRLQQRYGISHKEYDEKLKQQNETCPICGGIAEHLDHDHKSEKIRDFLCGNCNWGLGNFRDNIQFLQSAISYLEKHA